MMNVMKRALQIASIGFYMWLLVSWVVLLGLIVVAAPAVAWVGLSHIEWCEIDWVAFAAGALIGVSIVVELIVIHEIN